MDRKGGNDSSTETVSTQRRRHSSYQPIRENSYEIDAEAVFVKVDLFISELERRLQSLEHYGNLHLDAGLARAFSVLEAVRDSCSHVSGEIIGAGRRRASLLVNTLEQQYNYVLPTKQTLEAKAQAAMRLMESFLTDIEIRASRRGSMISGIMDEGRRLAEEGLEKAKEVLDESLEAARRAKESLKESIDHAIKRAQENGLIRYEDLPHPWRVNPHITKGYRFSTTKMGALKSAFNVSNESVNIWSHAIGFFIIVAIAFHFYPNSISFSQSSKADVIFAAIFFFAACKCLICSCVWHTMSSIAEQTLMERFACVDYTGISVLIAASIMTTEWTAFYCEPISRWAYIISTAVLGIGGVVFPWQSWFNRADMAWARVFFYVSLAATGGAPVIHLSFTRGSLWCWHFYRPIAESIAVYLGGALIYAGQVPERWLRGWFDYVGGSHNIWHFAVLGGILFHYSAMQSFFSSAFERAVTCPATVW